MTFFKFYREWIGGFWLKDPVSGNWLRGTEDFYNTQVYMTYFKETEYYGKK